MPSAFLPAQLVHVAAQFASPDPCKQALTGILVRPAGDGGSGVTIASTDGLRLFSVTCPDTTWRCDQPILINAKAFKKRIPYARFVAIDSDHGDTARIMGGKGASAEFMQAIPWEWAMDGCAGDPALRYPNIDQLWPDSYGEGADTAISFNAQLLADFLIEVKRYSWNGVVTMKRNGEHNPFVLISLIRDTSLEDVEMRFLLMPVQTRV